MKLSGREINSHPGMVTLLINKCTAEQLTSVKKKYSPNKKIKINSRNLQQELP